MKKLKLKALELGAKEVLTRAQLKNVLGGDGSGALCTVSFSCTLYIRELGYSVVGSCYYATGGSGTSGCYCGAEVNGQLYKTDPNQYSECWLG